MSATRKWHMAKALESFRSLGTVIEQLTLDEIYTCLDLEMRSQRRRSVSDRLIKRALVLTSNQLKEKYQNGQITIQNHDNRREETGDSQPESHDDATQRFCEGY